MYAYNCIRTVSVSYIISVKRRVENQILREFGHVRETARRLSMCTDGIWFSFYARDYILDVIVVVDYFYFYFTTL